MFAIFFLIIVIGGIIGANVWYKIDYQKCSDVSSNDYYYSQNNCWETFNMPGLVMGLMFIAIMSIPGCIWLVFLIKYLCWL